MAEAALKAGRRADLDASVAEVDPGAALARRIGGEGPPRHRANGWEAGPADTIAGLLAGGFDEERWTKAADEARRTGHPDAAIWWLAEVARAQAGRGEALPLARTLHRMGDAQWQLGNLAGARELLALHMERTEVSPAPQPEIAATMNLLGQLAHARGEPAVARQSLANVLVKRGRPDEARPLFEHAHAAYRAQLGEDHPDTRRVAARLVQF